MKRLDAIRVVLFLAAALLLGSCSDFLVHDSKGVMSENEFFSSPEAAYKTVVKCYGTLNDFFGYERPVMDIGDISTDDAEKGGSDAGDGAFVLDLSYGRATSGNTDLANLWQQMYLGIARCNTVLANIPERDLVDEYGYPLSETQKARYMAEARFLRAWFYFELVKVFGGVPIVDRTLTVADSKALKRATEAETAKFILEDLALSADSDALPSKGSLPSGELGRVTKEAVWAMQARVYLYFAKDDTSLFVQARDAAFKVIDAGTCALEPNFLDLFLENGYRSDESIFANIRGDVPTNYIYGSFVPVYSNPRSCGAYGFDQPTQNLVDEFEEGDPRLLYTVVQPGDEFPKGKGSEVLDFSSYPNTGYHSRKTFLVESRRGIGWGDDAWSRHLIRYADVLLMYAEALVQSGGSKSEAAEYINMVRCRADASRGGDSEAVSRVMTIPNVKLREVSASDDLMEAIKHERRVEFAMEFNRFYDLKRWNAYIDTMNAFASLPESNGRGSAFKKGINEVFPIPQSEIDRTGGSIVQNEGYN